MKNINSSFNGNDELTYYENEKWKGFVPMAYHTTSRRNNNITTTKIDVKDKEKEIIYPCIMMKRSAFFERLIVLFAEKGKGTVIWSSSNSIGNYAGYYTDGWDMSDFEVYDGPVELKNRNHSCSKCEL